MKSTKHLLLIILALISINVNAQETVSETINVATAGTLSSLIPSSKKYEITNLTLTGFLNGTDIRYIREMAGRNLDYSTTTGKLSFLDLSGTNIIEGGDSYDNMHRSSKNCIEDYTFNGCSTLTTVILPSSVTVIGKGAFLNCTALTNISIPNNVTTIEDYAFQYCAALNNLTIPNSVTTIGGYALQYCDALTNITISNRISKIEVGLFANCKALTTITIPNSVTRIEGNAFRDCTRLTSFTIPNSVTEIGNNVFDGCIRLASIFIPNSVSEIGHYVFKGCERLTSVTIPSNVTTIRTYAFAGCSALTTITIPSSVTEIMDYAFSNCTELISVITSNGLTKIGSNVFNRCNKLSSFTIPSSVTKIGESPFDNCGLSEIHCKASNPPIALSYSFENTTHIKLYVPIGSYNSYRNADGWCDFREIIEEVVTSTTDIDVSNINVYLENGSIIVKGGKLGDTVDIYSVSGSLLHKIKITDDIVRISVAPQSLYIVKTGDRSFKIAMQ